MSFKYFLDMAPEDEVINPSSLTKFRKLRLKDMNLLDMLIAKTVQIALDKGIIKSKSIIVDATHTKSRYNQKTPREALQNQSKKLRRTIYEIDETMNDESEENINKLYKALTMLQPDERALITLFYEQEKTIQEIQQILNVKESFIKVKLHRIRKKLYILMKKEEEL